MNTRKPAHADAISGPSRRDAFRSAAVAACGATLLVGAIVAGRAEAQTTKLAQSAAAYQPTPKNGQSCASCALFLAPNGCKLVDGTISAAGWCKFYAKKS